MLFRSLLKISALLIESSESSSLNISSEEESPLQIDEIVALSMSESDISDSDSPPNHINMLTKDQEILIETIKHISDSKLQKRFLDKFLKSLEDKP